MSEQGRVVKVQHKIEFSLGRDAGLGALDWATKQALREGVPSSARAQINTGYLVLDWTTDEVWRQ